MAASASRGPYRNGVRSRKEIVVQAGEVFAEFGYVGGSIRTIAARVGMSPASLLQHFGNKEGLLEAVLEDWSRQTGEQHVGDQLRGLAWVSAFRGLMRFHVAHRGLLELFLTMAVEATSITHPARGFIQQRYADGLARMRRSLREASDLGEVGPMTDGQIEAEASMFYAVVDGLELQWLLDNQVDLVGLVDTYLDLAVARWRVGLPHSSARNGTGSRSPASPDQRDVLTENDVAR